MNGPQHFAKALTLVDDARLLAESGEDVEQVLAISVAAIVEILAALTLATVHRHLPERAAGKWGDVASAPEKP